MVNWALGDEREREETDKLKIKLATPKIKILVNFNEITPLLVEFISRVATIIEISSPLPE
jgi:hypothetical protein